jgi:hypothetical protein
MSETFNLLRTNLSLMVILPSLISEKNTQFFDQLILKFSFFHGKNIFYFPLFSIFPEKFNFFQENLSKNGKFSRKNEFLPEKFKISEK